MKHILKKLIKEEVRRIILEQTNETSGEPFGNYLWADEQNLPDLKTPDQHINEPNTKLEQEFYYALEKFVDGGVAIGDAATPILAKFIKTVLRPLKNKKEFSQYILPPDNLVYRGLHNININDAAKMLNVSYEELITNSGKPHFIKSDTSVRPVESIMSWSNSKDVALSFTFFDTGQEIKNKNNIQTLIVLVAHTHDSGNDFYLNLDRIADNFNGFQNVMSKEEETLSLGPVTIRGAYVLIKNFTQEYNNRIEIFKKIFPQFLKEIEAFTELVLEQLNNSTDEYKRAIGKPEVRYKYLDISTHSGRMFYQILEQNLMNTNILGRYALGLVEARLTNLIFELFKRNKKATNNLNFKTDLFDGIMSKIKNSNLYDTAPFQKFANKHPA